MSLKKSKPKQNYLHVLFKTLTVIYEECLKKKINKIEAMFTKKEMKNKQNIEFLDNRPLITENNPASFPLVEAPLILFCEAALL